MHVLTQDAEAITSALPGPAVYLGSSVVIRLSFVRILSPVDISKQDERRYSQLYRKWLMRVVVSTRSQMSYHDAL